MTEPKIPSEATVRLVRAFVEVANTKSTAEAAKRLGMRADAMQSRIRTLERICGVSLINIEPPHWHVALTEDGTDRLSAAISMVRAHDALLMGKPYRNTETDEKIGATVLAETLVRLLHRDLDDDQLERLHKFLRDF